MGKTKEKQKDKKKMPDKKMIGDKKEMSHVSEKRIKDYGKKKK